MKYLKTLLNEFPLEQFLEKHFTRLPYSQTNGGRELTELLNWQTVERINSEKNSIFRIVHEGKVIKDYVQLTDEEIRNYHKSGHTILIRYAEKSDEYLKKLANDFSQSFHTEVDIQLYCTPEGHNAFGWHFDVEEVFIIQCKGSKHYTIRPNTVHPNPVLKSISKDMGYEKEKTPFEINVTLEEGDWLYIPSGWWHVAKTQKESMHISIGLMPLAAIDLLSHLPEFLAQSTFWRTRLPLHKNFNSEEEEDHFYQEAMQKLSEDLKKNFSSSEYRKFCIQKLKKINETVLIDHDSMALSDRRGQS